MSCTPKLFGLAGIFGFSALLIGGGSRMEDFGVVCARFAAASGVFVPLFISKRSPLSARGVPGRVDDLLEWCDINSRTFAKGVMSIRSGEVEACLAVK